MHLQVQLDVYRINTQTTTYAIGRATENYSLV